jgi:3-hydroxyisobutyrate dehydrogenase-like beta-hydroxyacid dehydrogenase
MALAIRAASLMHIAATGECFNLAQAKGVATDLVYNLISGAAGSSNQFNGIFPLMMQKDFVPSQKATSMTTAIKDLVSVPSVVSRVNC